jgi:hypothetical protein
MVLLTVLPYESFANEIKNTNAKDAVEIAADKLSEQKEEKTAVNQNQKNDDFKPDEEISEDFPVPIPYDI